jgi:Tol biopolymer transport system component
MKLFYFLFLSILSLLLYSCSKDGNPNVQSFYINRIYSINIDGGDKKLLAVGNNFSILDNNKMIYINDHKLYLSNSDGSNKEIISDNNFEIYNYQLYLNGTKIMFKQSLYPNNSLKINLYTMNIDGSGLTELNIPNNINLNYGASISPDGSKIVFANSTGLYFMNTTGLDQKQIKDSSNRSYCYDFKFTPDGNNIIYVHDVQYGVALDLRLYNTKSFLDTSLFYNDDGNKIISYNISKWNTLLFSNGSGINLENLNNYTHSFLYRGGDPFFSNDSTKITFMNYDFTAVCILDLTQNSTKIIEVNLPKNFISHPMLSLDGNKIIFQADTSWEIINKVKSNDDIVY